MVSPRRDGCQLYSVSPLNRSAVRVWLRSNARVNGMLSFVPITRTSAGIATVCVASAGLGVWLASPAGRNVPLLNMLSVISLSVGVITTARDATFCWQHGRKRLAVLRALAAGMLAMLLLLPISRMLRG